ncbi:MAG: hypothetical protein ABFD44_00740 [Anaerolineaceae bacterium]
MCFVFLGAAGCGTTPAISAQQFPASPNRFTATAGYIHANATAQSQVSFQQMTLAAEENNISESYRRCTDEAIRLTQAVETAAAYQRSLEPTSTATPQPPALSPEEASAMMWAAPTLTLQAITLQAVELRAQQERRLMGWLPVGITLLMIGLAVMGIMLAVNLLSRQSHPVRQPAPCVPAVQSWAQRVAVTVIVVSWEKTLPWLEEAQDQRQRGRTQE